MPAATRKGSSAAVMAARKSRHISLGIASFLGGRSKTLADVLAGIFLIDLLVPHDYIGQHDHTEEQGKLMRTGMLVALGIAIHNFPEGIVVAAGYGHAAELGILVALMICFHNIPEGIATVSPLIQAGVPKWRAVGIATLGGLMEPLGALLGALIISISGASIVGWGLGFAAGVMTYVTIDELIPIAHEYCSLDHKHMVSTGLLIGMIFAMVLGLFLHQ